MSHLRDIMASADPPITHQELAVCIGVDRTRVTRIVNGRSLYRDNMFAVQAALKELRGIDVSLDDLFRGDGAAGGGNENG